jgi:hypothetical protein
MSIAGVQELSKVESQVIESGEGAPAEALAGMGEGIGRFVEQAAREGVSLREFERDLFDRLLKMGQAATEQFLALQGDGDQGETTEHEGRTVHRSAEPARRKLRTIFGEHQFFAYVYRERRHPNTPIVLRPVDVRLGIAPDRWSPLLQEFTMLFGIEEAFEPATDAFRRIFRQRLSVDTLEQVSQRMGTAAGEFLDHLETPPAEEEGELLVLTADGKGVPMVQEDAGKLNSFEEKPQRPGNRRMATLAGVYSVDRYVRTPEEIVKALFRDDLNEERPEQPLRPKPCHKRLTARFPQVLEDLDETEPVSGSLLALSWAAREVEQRRQTGQVLIRLMDGQHSLWETADACCNSAIPEACQVDILDILHVAGYVWRAAKVFHHHREHQEAFTRERLLRILNGEVQGVITGLKQMATRHGLTGKARQEIDTVCGYFAAHRERMQYDEYLANGYPIATGVIEGACRHLVKDRMERSGMRWTLTGAQAMLHLRALRESSYWNQFQEQRASNQNPATQLTG